MAGMRPSLLSRRAFLGVAAAATTGALGAKGAAGAAGAERAPKSARKTRGVVIYPSDLSLRDWPARAARAGLTTIALHTGEKLATVTDFIASDTGVRFLTECRALGLQVEYELHAMRDLLPRDLFAKDPGMFRQDAAGNRTPDANLCPHSKAALDTVAENAARIAAVLAPTTGRFFYWPDDGRPWCQCPRCKGLGASDQALLVENHVLEALRRRLVGAQLAHLAYQSTLAPPRQVKPLTGVFLEFAPICRDYTQPLGARDAVTRRGGGPDPATNGGYVDLLDANLAVFEAGTAQALEYWLDVSMFSGWKRPGVKLPWRADVCRRDAALYRARGIGHVTTFAAWIDAEYVQRHGGVGFIDEYGAILRDAGNGEESVGSERRGPSV